MLSRVRGSVVGGSRWHRSVVLLFVLILLAGSAIAATAPPADLSQEQFDALVARISETVARDLAAKGLAVPAPAPRASPAALPSGDLVVSRIAELLNRFPSVVNAVPELPAQTAHVLARLDSSPSGGLSRPAFLGLLAGSVAVAVAISLGLRRSFQPLRRRWASSPFLSMVARLAVLDLAAFGLFWAVTRLTLAAFDLSPGFQFRVATSVLDGVVLVAACTCLLEIWLRPRNPLARIVPVSDGDAVRLKRNLVALVVVAFISREWLSLMSVPTMIQAVLLVNAVYVPGLAAIVAVLCRKAFGAWLAGLAGGAAGVPDHAEAQASRPPWSGLWLAAILPLIGIGSLMQVYAALSGRPEVPLGTLTTIFTLLALLLGETLIRRLARDPGAKSEGDTLKARILLSAARLIRVTMVLVAGFVLARVWCVNVFGAWSDAEWHETAQPWRLAAGVLLLAAASWEAVRVLTDPRADARKSPLPANDGESGLASSRAETLMPLFRVALFIVIGIVAILASLSELGVNITPLLAGASIFGLAISFGSQTLVKDIVSGVFYLAEDAFRVGEYIDCGKAKGTVEGFALRSLKLRHQNGQLHTIPFGQLGQVTNFSRDWTTIKFNLRFARHTDLEVLRKATKRIGQRLAEDPELKGDFLEPLKMQGVFDVVDDAIIVRFKMTALPTRPSLLQREAMRRLYCELPAAGVSFAQSIWSVGPTGLRGPLTPAFEASTIPPPHANGP